VIRRTDGKAYQILIGRAVRTISVRCPPPRDTLIHFLAHTKLGNPRSAASLPEMVSLGPHHRTWTRRPTMSSARRLRCVRCREWGVRNTGRGGDYSSVSGSRTSDVRDQGAHDTGSGGPATPPPPLGTARATRPLPGGPPEDWLKVKQTDWTLAKIAGKVACSDCR
jgi:hypothetical protein